MLSSESLKEVAECAKVLKAFPKVHIYIVGHTDSTGDRAKNKALSLARANAVENQFVASGVNPNRLLSIGSGASKPFNLSNPTSKENRRIEILVTKR